MLSAWPLALHWSISLNCGSIYTAIVATWLANIYRPQISANQSRAARWSLTPISFRSLTCVCDYCLTARPANLTYGNAYILMMRLRISIFFFYIIIYDKRATLWYKRNSHIYIGSVFKNTIEKPPKMTKHSPRRAGRTHSYARKIRKTAKSIVFTRL